MSFRIMFNNVQLLADHRIPVELSLTSKLLQKAIEVKTFSGNPIGLFIGKFIFLVAILLLATEMNSFRSVN